MNTKPRLSVLISARKNSKYLGKFLFGYFANTSRPDHAEVLVMLNQGDTWNAELVQLFSAPPYNVQFFYEDYQLGRAGLHIYFNDLYKQSRGDWLIYFCEDHFITKPGWDQYIYDMVAGEVKVQTEMGAVLKHEFGMLNPAEPWCIVPKFDNAGAMNQILSRGYCEAIGDVIGRHGWIDSYINDLNTRAWGAHPQRVLRLDAPIFHDFTHDHPNPMDDAHLQSVVGPAAGELPKHNSTEYWAIVEADVNKLKGAV